MSADIDYTAAEGVEAHIQQIRAAGLNEAADIFSNVYWAWLRTTSAYVAAHPYVRNPDPGTGMTPISALTVVDFTIKHWSPSIPGTPRIDDEAVLREAAADEAWHRAEDLRMRREAEGQPS